MTNPATLYTIKNKETNEILLQTINYQLILDLILQPLFIEEGAILNIPNNPVNYKIHHVSIQPYQTEQLYNGVPYAFSTLVTVSELG